MLKRKSKKDKFKCKNCGHENHADLNASKKYSNKHELGGVAKNSRETGPSYSPSAH